MKKISMYLLALTLAFNMFCFVGCSMNDGEAGDKGNIQTDDIGDGGNDTTDDIINDNAKTRTSDNKTDTNVKDDIKAGMDSAGNMIDDGMNAVRDTVDDMMPDVNNR